MKNTVVYYLAIILPVIAIFVLKNTGMISSNWFVYTFVLYLLVYRSCTDGLRLAGKGTIEKRNIWKVIVPGQRIKYFKELYLN